jgi:methyltransferase
MGLAAYIGLLAAVGAERIAELLLSRRNARLAFARGGVETGALHFRWMTLLHAAFLPACALEAARREFPGALGWVALSLVLCAQALRWWAIASLGESWNVRVIVVPDALPKRSGPYRWVRHPNYIAVIVELLCIPLVHGAWLCALVFSALNALVLRVRIRDEERALGPSWQREFAQVPRFIPHGGAGFARLASREGQRGRSIDG